MNNKQVIDKLFNNIYIIAQKYRAQDNMGYFDMLNNANDTQKLAFIAVEINNVSAVDYVDKMITEHKLLIEEEDKKKLIRNIDALKQIAA